MKLEEFFIGTIGSSFMLVGSSLSTTEIIKIISLVLSVIGFILTYIVLPLINHFKKAKEDGKITLDETIKGVEILKDGTEKVKEEIEKEKEK